MRKTERAKPDDKSESESGSRILRVSKEFVTESLIAHMIAKSTLKGAFSLKHKDNSDVPVSISL